MCVRDLGVQFKPKSIRDKNVSVRKQQLIALIYAHSQEIILFKAVNDLESEL